MAIINITRIDALTYSFKLSDKDGKRHVAAALTFENPDADSMYRKKEMFSKYDLTFLRGMLPNVLEYCERRGLTVRVRERDNAPEKSWWKADSRFSGKYEYQKTALFEWHARRFGIVQIPTRGGKTFFSAETVRWFLSEFRGQCMFVVDSTTLFTQAVADFQNFFKAYGGVEVGQIKQGKIETDKRVTVAMAQTLQSALSSRNRDQKKKARLKKFLYDLEYLIVDEIHENCSDARLKIWKGCKKLEQLLCISATPYRSGAFIQNLKLQAWSGGVVYEIPEEELREAGVLTDYRVFLLAMDHNEIDIIGGYDDYRNAVLFDNPKRNEVLRKVLSILDALNIKTLVLFQSIEHGVTISRNMGYPFIHGGTPNSEREERKTAFLNSVGGMLCASGIFKKGVTLPEAQVIINVDGGLEDANTVQKKGRVLGAIEGKTRSAVIDFMDIFDAYFGEHSLARFNTYVTDIGEENVWTLDADKEDWASVFIDWVETWFEVGERYTITQ